VKKYDIRFAYNFTFIQQFILCFEIIRPRRAELPVDPFEGGCGRSPEEFWVKDVHALALRP